MNKIKILVCVMTMALFPNFSLAAESEDIPVLKTIVGISLSFAALCGLSIKVDGASLVSSLFFTGMVAATMASSLVIGIAMSLAGLQKIFLGEAYTIDESC